MLDQKALGMKEISFDAFTEVKIGHAQNEEAATGCTVIVAPEGMKAGVDVRGGGPASRETTLLGGLASAEVIHAVTLSGGSAYGLEAGCGVAEALEEKGIGLDTGYAKVPLVCQSCIYDLGVGSAKIRPDKAMGRAAVEDASSGKNKCAEGNIGAGIGATVGKALGGDFMMKSGIGLYALSFGALKVGAMVVLNALGDIYDADSHEKIAGLLNQDKTGFRDGETTLMGILAKAGGNNLFTANTTLGVVLTNASFNKMECARIASQCHNGYARTIRPVHTSADGDSIYALSVGEVQANLDMVSAMATEAIARAVNRAARAAEPAYGLLCAKDFAK